MNKELAVKSIEELEEFYQFPFDKFLVGNQWVDIHELLRFIADELKGEQE